eukprot:13191241-Alexandrium_andersonii.AAC.1
MRRPCEGAPCVDHGRSCCAAGVREGARALPKGLACASKEDTGASRKRFGAPRPPSVPTAA